MDKNFVQRGIVVARIVEFDAEASNVIESCSIANTVCKLYYTSAALKLVTML